MATREDVDAQKTKQLVEAEGRKCLLLPGDIRQEAYYTQIVEDTIKQLGKLNILVNNTGLQLQYQTLEEETDEDLRATYETNIYSFFRISKAAVPHLQKGDIIVNTTSITAYQGRADLLLLEYSSTKGAIMTFTRALSSNLITKGIRVNAVAPGPIWTPLNPASVSAEEVAKFGKDVPMKRPGQPTELASAYDFLASEDASYYAGQVIHVNGGEVVNS